MLLKPTVLLVSVFSLLYELSLSVTLPFWWINVFINSLNAICRIDSFKDELSLVDWELLRYVIYAFLFLGSEPVWTRQCDKQTDMGVFNHADGGSEGGVFTSVCLCDVLICFSVQYFKNWFTMSPGNPFIFGVKSQRLGSRVKTLPARIFALLWVLASSNYKKKMICTKYGNPSVRTGHTNSVDAITCHSICQW